MTAACAGHACTEAMRSRGPRLPMSLGTARHFRMAAWSAHACISRRQRRFGPPTLPPKSMPHPLRQLYVLSTAHWRAASGPGRRRPEPGQDRAADRLPDLLGLTVRRGLGPARARRGSAWDGAASNDQTAVDTDHLPGHVARQVRREEQGHVRDVLGHADAPHSDVRP